MTVAVLCPGKSVTAFAPHWQDYDLRIAVNRVAQLYVCDWWTACDDRVVRTFPPVGSSKPRLFTTAECILRLGKHDLLKLYPDYDTVERLWALGMPRNIPYDAHGDGVIRDGPWMNKSTPSAIALAAHLGARKIDLWGADMAGHGDWDEFQYSFPNAESERACHTRSEQRWAQERLLLEGIRLYLAGRDCELNRKI